MEIRVWRRGVSAEENVKTRTLWKLNPKGCGTLTYSMGSIYAPPGQELSVGQFPGSRPSALNRRAARLDAGHMANEWFVILRRVALPR